jgi:hypothetical protein
LIIFKIVDQGKYFVLMPDGIVRISGEEAYLVAYGNPAGVTVVSINDAFFQKLYKGPRAADFTDPPAKET